MVLDSTNPKITLITGGARSGKSSYALSSAECICGTRLFIATASAVDDDLQQRIQKHRDMRDVDLWQTIEETIALSEVVIESSQCNVIVVDCLTFWLSNLLLKNEGLTSESLGRLVFEVCSSIQSIPAKVFLVSNELGMGVHPTSELGRNFRDLHGFMNQRFAEAADRVVLMVSGCPLSVKN